MGRKKFLRWLFESVADFLMAAWQGDPKKIALFAAIIIAGFLVVWVRWVMFRRRARQLGLPLDGSIPEDRWHPPSSEEVSKILKDRTPS